MKFLLVTTLFCLLASTPAVFAEGNGAEAPKSTDTVEPVKAPTAEQELFGRVRGAHLRAVQRGTLAMAATKSSS